MARHAVVACADVRSLTSEQVREATTTKTGELTLIAGGPSLPTVHSRREEGNRRCETGRLFLDFVRLVDELRPRWFLFENVKGLLLHKTDVAQVHCPRVEWRLFCRSRSAPHFLDEQRSLLIARSVRSEHWLKSHRLLTGLYA